MRDMCVCVCVRAGVCAVYALYGQQFSGGACIFAQLMCGVLVPGSARANIVAVMLVNTAVSQVPHLYTHMYMHLYMHAHVYICS